MKTPVDCVIGKITDISPNGVVTIKARYDDWFTLTKREYKDAYIEFRDSRKLSDEQRKMCWALIGAIADYTGEERADQSEFMKMDFMINEMGESCRRLFSLSDAPMSLVCAYQRYLVRFIVRHDIPTKFSLLDYVEDTGEYVYTCLKYKKCCICGKHADLHHVDRVGMGRDRTDIVHLGMEALPLCRAHHTEAHSMSDSQFFSKYHLDSGVILDKAVCRVYGLKTTKER